MKLLHIFVPLVAGHSWLECTDYRIQTSADAETWDKALCHGYARCGSKQAKVAFGKDTGFDHNYPKNDDNACQCAAGSSYDANAPMAQYTPGQRVCLAYPAKNHVAETCTNEYIPDNGVRIFRTNKNPTNDPELFKWPVEYQHLNGVHQDGQIDYKGFQNCPKFCDDPDKALCTLCFDLEPNLASGLYSFHFEWHFNSGVDYYTSCWEAQVGEGGAPPRPPSPPDDASSTNENSPPKCVPKNL